jgi:hypothetical protein
MEEKKKRVELSFFGIDSASIASLAVLIATVLLVLTAVSRQNPISFVPFVCLLIMVVLGDLPLAVIQTRPDLTGFLWTYFLLIWGSFGLLVLANNEHWPTPMVVGVLANIIGGKIRLTSENALWFYLVVGGSIALSLLACLVGNQYWSSPLVALALMVLFNNLSARDKLFHWLYIVLIFGSVFLLMRTTEQTYWATPLLLGVIMHLTNFPISIQRR